MRAPAPTQAVPQARFSSMIVAMSDQHAKETDKKPVVPANEPPAQEIADDEVEIAETGGKPGEEEESP